jgi:hypothetical protein
MLDRLQHAPVHELRIPERLLHGVDRGQRHVLGLRQRNPLVTRLAEHHSGDRGALPKGVVSLGIVDPVFGRHAGHVAEAGPELLLDGAQRHMAAIGAGVDAVARRLSDERPFAAPRLDAAKEKIRAVKREPGDRAVRHGDVDILAPAGRGAGQQRRQNARGRHQRTAAHVGDRQTRHDGRLARLAEELQCAGQGEVVDVVAGRQAPWAVLSEAGDGAVHEARIALLEHVVGEPQAFHHAWPEAFQNNVGRFGKLEESRFS